MAVGGRRARSPNVKRPVKTRTPAKAQAMPSGKPPSALQKGVAAGKKALAKGRALANQRSDRAKKAGPLPPMPPLAKAPPPPSAPSGGGGPKIAPKPPREPRARRPAPRVGRSKKKGPRV